MTERPAKLTHVEIRDLYHAVLGPGSAALSWLPPAPEELAPHFPGFEISALIARGGMGAVYQARQLSLSRTVAIKLLPFDLGAHEDFAERFRREAIALARLKHPHIVTVYDYGQADDGHYFMVMEFVEGTDLATRLHTGGPLPPEEALRIVRQVCEALHYAHSQGVVHRDIKPANILLDASGQVKVSDFGIAQFAYDQTTAHLTVTGTLLGTPAYTAPEQLLPQGPVDHRADIFSVGVMLYELLTGQLPRGVFRPVAELVPAARGLDAVLARAMQSEPDRRQRDVLELSVDLAKAGPAGRRRVTLWVIAALTLVLISVGTLWSLSQAPKPFVSSLGLTFVPAGTPGVLFSTTETRVRDFEAFVRAGGYVQEAPIYVNYDGTQIGWMLKDFTWRSPSFTQAPEHPVVGITLFEAEAFCEWLTQHDRASGRIGSGDRYRLPTDTEWSLAVGIPADAHDPSGVYPWDGDYPPPPEAGNFASEEVREDPAFAQLPIITGRRDPHPFTAPVGSYKPNRHGLYDMGGNVAEYLQIEPDGSIFIRGSNWWDSPAAALDAGHRRPLGREVHSFNVGFRIVLERASS